MRAHNHQAGWWQVNRQREAHAGTAGDTASEAPSGSAVLNVYLSRTPMSAARYSVNAGWNSGASFGSGHTLGAWNGSSAALLPSSASLTALHKLASHALMADRQLYRVTAGQTRNGKLGCTPPASIS